MTDADRSGKEKQRPSHRGKEQLPAGDAAPVISDKGKAPSGYWVEIKAETTSVAGAEMVGEILIKNGCGGVVYHDPFLRRNELSGEEALVESSFRDEAIKESVYAVSGYLPLDDGLDERLAQIRRDLLETGKYLPIGTGEITLTRVKEEDWANAWKAHFHPMTVGRIVITPTWIETPLKPGQVLVGLDPGMAFGTGSHLSTQLALRLLSEEVRGGEVIYDIGTGSGILAISAAKLGASAVTAVDIDPKALAVARENVRWNRMEERIRVVKGDLLTGLTAGEDLVVANIIAEVIREMAPQVAQALKPEGAFLSSGIIKEKAGWVREGLEAEGFFIEKEVTADDWTAFLARRKSHA